MTKILSVLFLVVCGVSSHAVTPIGMQSHWGIDFNAGWSSITNAPANTTPDYATMISNPPVIPKVDDVTIFNIKWVTYNPQWRTMQPRGGRSGAVIQGGVSYLHVGKYSRVGMGVYALFGYNSARASSFFQPMAGQSSGLGRKQGNNVIYQGFLIEPPIQSKVPEAKVTVSSSTTLETGVRLGIGQVRDRFFPYVKAGWGLYRLRAGINALWSPPEDQYFKVTNDPNESKIQNDIYSQGAKGNGANIKFQSHVYIKGQGNLQELWPTQMAIVSSGPRWVNAGVVGVGIDFAPHHNIVVGFSYQAAICGHMTFKKWDKPLAGGIELVSHTGSSENGDPSNKNSWYNIGTSFSKVPFVTIRPIFQSVMVNVRYVFPC